MNRLEKKLKELQSKGFETITIEQVILWIRMMRKPTNPQRGYKVTYEVAELPKKGIIKSESI